jgi:NADH-quinone oxidoreductase subunit A
MAEVNSACILLESKSMISEFSHVFAFIILAILFVAGGLATSWLLRPRNPNKFKLAAYECGEDPVGGAWVKFNIRYYVVALIFILFDVEIMFLFPWAIVLKPLGWLALTEMFTFIGILLVGYIYVWGKGDLEWARPKPFVARLKDVVTIRPRETTASSLAHEEIIS